MCASQWELALGIVIKAILLLGAIETDSKK